MGAEPEKQSVGRGSPDPAAEKRKYSAASRKIIRKRMAAFRHVRDIEDAVPYR